MKILYCVICGKYRKFEKSEISYLLEKILVLSADCKNGDEKIFKRRKINWNIQNFWFDWKYIITLKIWVKKTKVKNLD